MKKIIVLAGPTAVGKTKYSIEIAKAMDCEIVSCDSMQLYKHLDIGSAKPTEEELAQVKHYLVDQFDPKKPFSVATYQEHALYAIEKIHSKGKTPLISGGTGLYLNSLIFDMDFSGTSANLQLRKGLEHDAQAFGNEFVYEKLVALDPLTAERIHPNNLKKVIRAIEAATAGSTIKDFNNCSNANPNFDIFMICLTRDREELYDRINKRVDILVQQGLIEEVKGLMESGLKASDISMKGIGYKEIIDYLDGQYDLETAIDLVKKNTRHYAKRQITWFKRYEDMKWYNLSQYETDEDALNDIMQEIKKWIQTKE